MMASIKSSSAITSNGEQARPWLPTKAIKFFTPKGAKNISRVKRPYLPFLGVYGGNYNNSTFNNGGTNGNYWSSTAYDESNAYNLNYNSGNANMNNNNKRNGFSLRCVAKS